MGCFETGIGVGYRYVYFKGEDLTRDLANKMPEHLNIALTAMSSDNVCASVDHY